MRASVSRLPSRPVAIALRRVSRPSTLVWMRPTASAVADNGWAPRMLTARNWASSDSRPVRTSVMVSAADETACADSSTVTVKLWAVVDASWSACAVRSMVVARLPTVVSASVRRPPTLPFTQMSATRQIAATTSPTMP